MFLRVNRDSRDVVDLKDKPDATFLTQKSFVGGTTLLTVRQLGKDLMQPERVYDRSREAFEVVEAGRDHGEQDAAHVRHGRAADGVDAHVPADALGVVEAVAGQVRQVVVGSHVAESET